MRATRTLVIPALLGGLLLAPGHPAGVAPHPTGNEGVPRFGHVFLLIGENTNLRWITPASAPFMTHVLMPAPAWLTDYHGLHDGSLANYIGILSGQYTKCEVNNDTPDVCDENAAGVLTQL